MGYQALYRQWRPQDFAGLVGQGHISHTLQNAVKNGRVAHAYLFTGPRGTGKTSTAKILAKAVNCLAPQEGRPCNTCVNCENINKGRSLDVLEIDAASNRGIDEIREIRDRVHFVPSQGKFKVYIIDEVHMLTMEAFNALLKTLEEPPVHVIFILATTEPHKIPATILSRCQRYDFRKISPLDIEAKLKEVLVSSKMTIEEGALQLIVRKAEGGLRDALSILDQCMTFHEQHISLESTYQVLGVVKKEALYFLTEAIIHKDTALLLAQLNSLCQEGMEPGQILKDVLEYFRNIMLLLVCGIQTELVVDDQEGKKALLKQGETLGLAWLSQAVALLAKVDSESRWRSNMRIILETTLIGLLFQEENTPFSTVQEKVPEQVKQEKIKLIKKDKGEKEFSPINKESGQEKAVSLELVQEKWPQIMEKIKEAKKTIYAFMTVCEPHSVQGTNLLLLFKSGYTFHKEKVEDSENKHLIEGILEKIVGGKLTLKCIIEEEETSQIEDPVKKALELFGPDVVSIKE